MAARIDSQSSRSVPSFPERASMNITHCTIAAFARDILGKPLYPYQAEVAEAILTAIVEGQGRIFTVREERGDVQMVVSSYHSL